ncbi:signal peptidase I [Robertmurraya massiliosenegalensis]|uniref:signal peptidase I n=1 Tax=Robertmurraya TaxID=2837507 RepID=UPI0039A49403
MSNFNPKALRQELNKRAAFSDKQKELIKKRITSKEIIKQKRPLTPLVSTFVAIVLLSILFSTSGIFSFNKNASQPDAITDPDTKIDVEKVQNVTSDMIIIHPMYDDMDRGNHDFYDKDVVVDTKYYGANQIHRGDIIAYKKDNFKGVTRIIALPGEKIKIVKGQFFINGKILDSFYGRAHRLGLDVEELKSLINKGKYDNLQAKTNIESSINNFENTNEKEIEVPEGYVYIMGDDWLRTSMRGLLPTKEIIGKVIGYQ